MPGTAITTRVAVASSSGWTAAEVALESDGVLGDELGALESAGAQPNGKDSNKTRPSFLMASPWYQSRTLTVPVREHGPARVPIRASQSGFASGRTPATLLRVGRQTRAGKRQPR